MVADHIVANVQYLRVLRLDPGTRHSSQRDVSGEPEESGVSLHCLGKCHAILRIRQELSALYRRRWRNNRLRELRACRTYSGALCMVFDPGDEGQELAGDPAIR